MELSQTEALLLSIVIEACAGALLLMWTGWAQPLRAIVAASAGTLLTHPFVWWSVGRFEDGLGYAGAVALAEVFAFAVETPVWRYAARLSWSRAGICSLAANGASFLVGLWLQGG